MPIAVSKRNHGRVIEADVSEKLTRPEYDQFRQEAQAATARFGKIGVILNLHHFQGEEMGALWDDVEFHLEHFGDIQRLAIVGDSKWDRAISDMAKLFTLSEVKYFHTDDLEKARVWVA